MGYEYNILDGALAGAVNSEPDIKLSEAAMIDNSNVLIEDGEVKTSTMRLLEAVDNNANTVKIPEFSFPIISVTEATDTIIAEGIGYGAEVGDTIYLMNSKDVSTNYNDGYYTIATVSESGNTTITTDEDLAYDSTQGDLFIGTGETLKIRTLLLDDSSEEIFFFTKNNIFQWKISGLYFDTLTAPYTLENIEHWSVDQGLVNFGTTGSPDTHQGLIACNGVGRPLKISDAGIVTNLLAVIDGSANYVSVAKHCIFYENYLLLGNVTLNTGDDFPTRFYNSDILDTANFETNDSSFFITEGVDHLTAFGKEKDNLIIFKQESIIQAYFTATADVFQLNRISTPIGCIAPDSIINDRNNFLYFFGTDKRFKILRTGGDISDVIEKTVRNIKDSLITRIVGAYVRDDDRLIWAIPEGANTEGNNKVVVIKDRVWSFLDIDVSAFSVFRKISTNTWETINPTITWDSVPGQWGTVTGDAGTLLQLCTDYEGNVSTLFNSPQDYGQEYESYVVISTDLNKKGSLNKFKRITKIRFYFNPVNTNDTIYLDISKDNSVAYTNLTSFSAFSADVDMNIINKAVSARAKSFRLKFRSVNPFSLIGLIVYFEVMGDR